MIIQALERDGDVGWSAHLVRLACFDHDSARRKLRAARLPDGVGIGEFDKDDSGRHLTFLVG